MSAAQAPLDARAAAIDILVDGQRFGRFNGWLLLWSFLAMVADGYDISALASAAPELARIWHVAPKSFGPAFSASLAGVLFGAPLLGWLGDRAGRRPAIVGGCLVYGLGTLATVWTHSLDEIIGLRFLTGIGIGGLMPNTIALNSELSPKRLRATLIVLMFTGITTGSGLPGGIQAWLVPRHGWQVLFWIGGLAPLVIAAGLWRWLPESVKFLSRRPGRRDELLRTLARMRPDLGPGAGDAAVGSPAMPLAPAPQAPIGSLVAGVLDASGLGALLGRGLAWITPLLWLCFAAALMANYFLVSWLPLVLVGSGLTGEQSGLTTSFYHYGGTLGGLLVSFVLGRFGFAAVAVLFLLAVPAIAAIGLAAGGPGAGGGATVYPLLAAAVALAGFATLGAQFGNNAASGLLYPTPVRARGVGWALGIGRFGSMLGPLVGGVLIGWKLPLERLFFWAAVPMVVGLLASLGVALLCLRRLGGLQLEDLPAHAP